MADYEALTTPKPPTPTMQAKALFDFQGETQRELEFKKVGKGFTLRVGVVSKGSTQLLALLGKGLHLSLAWPLTLGSGKQSCTLMCTPYLVTSEAGQVPITSAPPPSPPLMHST